MKKQNTFDVIVIGSGAAGFSAVEAAVQQGASVCLIEKSRLGGECPNDACVPSKALLKSAAVYRQIARSKEYGIEASVRSLDWTSVMKYRDQVVKTVTGGGDIGDRYLEILKTLNVSHRIGTATFVDDQTIEVGEERLTAKGFVLATGTTDFIPPITGIEEIPYWGWREALRATKQPKSMAIIGAGPVGCEIATLYASFGTRVVLVQTLPFVLDREDVEISRRAAEALRHIGVDVVTEAKITELVNGRVGVIGVKVMTPGQVEQMFAVERVVIATGKRANVQELGLDTAGVDLDTHGNIKTNAKQRTSAPHIFSAGDVDGGLMFTHTAHHEGWIAGGNAALFAKKKQKLLSANEHVVPRVTFIDPEVASVGATEAEVRKLYGKVLMGQYEILQLGRAVTDHAQSGLIKLVAHPKTRKLLGAHLICPHAGELIHEAALVISLNATIDTIANMIHAYPTYAEGMKAAASVAVVS
ncbi:NAD(P)/FAD-dependent oxidoreductase [Candidatus Uhrbacteria bacterium]|nr:NAD(P)/FAD-dependent oxidoreductase [Candidatus Uhrbacteria bacterium]